MPKPYPKEFREDIVRAARNREPGTLLKQIAVDFGISESCLAGWLKAADVEGGTRPGVSAGEHAENRELKKRVRLLEQAHRANALFDAHRDDPEFGNRFLVDEARDAGESMAERTAWRICSDNGWWSAFGKKKARGKGKKPGPPVHDDLVKRNFTADAPNQVWLGDITEHLDQ